MMKSQMINKILFPALTLVALSMSLSSCKKDTTQINQEEEIQNGLSLDLIGTRANMDANTVAANMRLFTFYEGGADSKKFKRELTNISRQANTLKTGIEVGTWNLAMVSVPSNVQLIQPTAAQVMSASPMYKYAPTTDVLTGKSHNAAEIVFSNEVTPQITRDGAATMNATVARNVALVELIIKKAATSFDKNSTTHRLKLYSVPSTISYTGALLKGFAVNATMPDTLATPLVSRIALSDSPTDPGFYKSDTIRFIIPAHRGSDFSVNNPLDTTQLKMKVALELTRQGGSTFSKSKEIPLVAKCNKILRINLTVEDGIEVTSNILDWNYVSLNEGVGEVYSSWIYVKKGANGTGQSWRDPLGSIPAGIAAAEKVLAAGLPCHGILVAGGPTMNYGNDGEIKTTRDGIRLFGGWEGKHGQELFNDKNLPYTTPLRNLKDFKAYIVAPTFPITISSPGGCFDGFVLDAATTIADKPYLFSFMGGLANGASGDVVNAVEIKGNIGARASGQPLIILSKTLATNLYIHGVKASATTYPLIHLQDAKFINGHLSGNSGGNIKVTRSSVFNSVIWDALCSVSNDTPAENQYKNCIVGSSIPTPTGSTYENLYPVQEDPAKNTLWFSSTNVVPGPHFKNPTGAGHDFSALNSRAPMLRRGNPLLFSANTPFPGDYAKDFNGNPRVVLDVNSNKFIDVGCFQEQTLKGFELRWNFSDVFISTKAGVVSDHPAILFDNAEGALVHWDIVASPINNLFTTVAGSTSGSGATSTLGLFRLKSGSTANSGSTNLLCGTVTLRSDLGAYLPNETKNVYQTPGKSRVWTEGYAGSFHRWNETSERYIQGNNPDGGGWTVRIVSGMDWIKIDKQAKGAFGGEVQETFGGVVSGTGFISFRVGLKSQLTGGASMQPRYGLIVIERPLGVALFFVRQGERPDFVYRTTDPRTGGRAFARQMSPYNLTNPSGAYSPNALDVGARGGRFVDYPSKVGYFFKWNTTQSFLSDNSMGIISVPSVTVTKEWTVGDAYEACPNAATSGYNYFMPTEKEFGQSLYINREDEVISHVNSNFVWGRYADGYFDQLASGPGVNSVGSGANRAADGIIMYNDFDNAAVFLPIAGMRSGSSVSTSGSAWYWTSTSISSDATWNAHFSNNHIGMSCTRLYKGRNAAPTRCIVR